jgi:RHS repeat-associated protein
LQQPPTYNAADELCNTSTTSGATCATTPPGGTAYGYDANGNTTTTGADTQTYSVYNQVASTTTGGTTTSYTYAGTTNNARTAAGGDTFLNGALGTTKQTLNGQNISYIRDAQGTLIGIRYNGVTSYYVTDALGSVIYLSPGNNTTPTRYTYDAFGTTTNATGDLATTNPYRYATGYYDTTTGLTKMGARYYNPTQGRFTQNDPSGQEANRYLYAGADPVNATDPTGLNFLDGLFTFASDGIAVYGAVTATTAIAITGGVAGIVIASYFTGQYIASQQDPSGGTFCTIDQPNNCTTYVN